MEKKLKHQVFLRTIKLINVILMIIPFFIVWMNYYLGEISIPYVKKGNITIAILFAVLYFVMGRCYEAFLISTKKISETIYSQTLALVITNAITYVVIILLCRRMPNIMPLLFSFVMEILLSILWSVVAHKLYFSINEPQKTLIVYDRLRNIDVFLENYELNVKFDVIRSIEINTVPIKELLKEIDKVQTVFLCGLHSHERNVILKYCIAKDIRVYLNPRIGDVLMSSGRPVYMCNLPIMQVDSFNPVPEYVFCKRLIDVVLAGVALIILLPVIIITALCIRAEDKGPVFYKQCRLTKSGKSFNILKFRSMRTDAEKDGVARLSTGDVDPRITKVGRFIRKTRIDELPQLINILKGDMTIVGPRPERPEIAVQYEEELPEFRLRLQAKAGLTGLAQVYGKYNTTPYDKLQMDLMYIANASFLEDLRIMFATVKILFLKDSTEGIEEGQTTAEYSNKT